MSSTYFNLSTCRYQSVNFEFTTYHIDFSHQTTQKTLKKICHRYVLTFKWTIYIDIINDVSLDEWKKHILWDKDNETTKPNTKYDYYLKYDNE